MENWISVLVVPYTVTPFVIGLYTKTSNWVMLGILVFLSMISTACIKSLTSDMPYSWLQRPVGASNCNTRMNDGNQTGRPGFPSGHCAVASTFWVGVWFLTPYSYKQCVGIVGIVGILSMIWARQEKRCHSLLQTIAGTALGTGFAFLL